METVRSTGFLSLKEQRDKAEQWKQYEVLDSYRLRNSVTKRHNGLIPHYTEVKEQRDIAREKQKERYTFQVAVFLPR